MCEGAFCWMIKSWHSVIGTHLNSFCTYSVTSQFISISLLGCYFFTYLTFIKYICCLHQIINTNPQKRTPRIKKSPRCQKGCNRNILQGKSRRNLPIQGKVNNYRKRKKYKRKKRRIKNLISRDSEHIWEPLLEMKDSAIFDIYCNTYDHAVDNDNKLFTPYLLSGDNG